MSEHRKWLLRELEAVDQKAMLGNEEAKARQAALESDLRLTDKRLRECADNAQVVVSQLQSIKGLKLYQALACSGALKRKEV